MLELGECLEVVNYPEVDENIVIVSVGDDVVMLPKGAMPDVGDGVIIYELPDGTLISNGRNELPEVGDTVIVYPTDFLTGDVQSDLVAVTGGAAYDLIDYDISPSGIGFGLCRGSGSGVYYRFHGSVKTMDITCSKLAGYCSIYTLKSGDTVMTKIKEFYSPHGIFSCPYVYIPQNLPDFSIDYHLDVGNIADMVHIWVVFSETQPPATFTEEELLSYVSGLFGVGSDFSITGKYFWKY